MSYLAQALKQQPSVPSHQHLPTTSRPTPASFASPPATKSPLAAVAKVASIPNLDGTMDIDLRCDAPKPATEEKTVAPKSSSSAPTPKAARPTPPPPPPRGTGSGLLSSSNLFGGPSSSEVPERKGVNIDLHIPLNPNGGNTINIAQEIAKKYGRDAINPRAAAHRALLLEVAEAANRIGGGSADDMSVDLMSDMGDESNVEMGGMEDEKSGTGGDNKPVRKRKPKTEEYDKEDEFIDDTELAWQQGAAVTKEGFFVFSGPLVPPGETANVESNAPARGRARGRGRGARGAAAAATTTTTGGNTSHAAETVEKAKDASAGAGAPTRGPRGGRGRATTTVRKPRVTKADRERMEAEKTDRERVVGGGPVGSGVLPAPLGQIYAGGQSAAAAAGAGV